MVDLNGLISDLDPQRIIDKCERPYDEALGSFLLPSTRLSNYQEVEQAFASFVYHVDQKIHGSAVIDHAMLVMKMRTAIEQKMPYTSAIHQAITGENGGIYGLFHLNCDHGKAEMKFAHFQHILTT